jgi:hypothetical protein
VAVLNTANRLYHGPQLAAAAYAGATKVWPSFTPTQITGLSVWLDAAQIINIAAQWDDASGHGNHGLTVGTPVPVVMTNRLNGHPIVRYALNGGRTRGNGTGVTFDYTLLYVGHVLTGTVGRVFGGIYQPVNILMGFNTSTNYDIFYDQGTIWQDTVAWTQPSPWRLYEMSSTATGNVVNVYVNGGLKATRSGPIYGLGGTYAISGYDPSAATATCNCDVAEVLIYNRVLTDPERQQVEGYLRTKYALY